MKNLSHFFNQNANWKNLLAVLAIYMAFPIYFLKNAESKINELAGKPVGIIDITVGYNPKKTLDMVANYGNARSFYAQTEMTTDFVYPIVYSILFGIILTLLFRNKSYKPFEYVNLLPLGAMFFDFLENAHIVYLLKTFPEQSIVAVNFIEIFKMMKWLVFGFMMLIILYGLIRLILTKLKLNS
jgi:hypothetical protein